MQDSKEISWASDYDGDSANESSATDPGTDKSAGHSAEPDGWQQYRKWISKAPAPRKRRTGVDPALYTWKGYRSWTEQIKRNWSDS